MKKRGQMPKSTAPHSTLVVCLEKGTALFMLDHILSLNCPPPRLKLSLYSELFLRSAPGPSGTSISHNALLCKELCSIPSIKEMLGKTRSYWLHVTTSQCVKV